MSAWSCSFTKHELHLRVTAKCCKSFFLALKTRFTPLQSFSCACKFYLRLQSYVHFHKSYHTHANLLGVKLPSYKWLLGILWQRILIYIQEVVWIEDQGEGTPLSCTLHFSYFRTSFSFSLWLGEWDHFTRRTETFQMISNMYSYFFVHTLHYMGFQWVLGEEERGEEKGEQGKIDETVSTGCELHCVLRLGCCCYICKR